MLETLPYALSLVSLGLAVLLIGYVRRAAALEKLLKTGEMLYRNQVPAADLETAFDIIFIDAESEPEFLRNRAAYDSGRMAVVCYHAPEYRMNLFRKKLPGHMIVCGDAGKELAQALDVKKYPSLLRLNYSKASVKKIM
ncbi:MAG TPA: hypothetical protein VNM49_10680 [Paenibacillus cookii]|nr:hypothetical protein [Paenibacillus cookii]